MIVRKPYAFLIKHFRKIHILLLALCAFIYYKHLQLSAFVNEFLDLGTYDAISEPITKHVSFFAIVSILLIIIGSAMLVLLLRHKKKPWKLYLLPVIEYLFLLIIFISTKSFFQAYVGDLETATIRALRDFIVIGTVFQYPAMLIFIIRIFGVDLKKFNFQLDQEYLELNNEDREELEININFDKESVKRGAKRLLRNLGYIYQEHKFIINIGLIILTGYTLYNSYQFIFVTNKAYKQGQTFETDGYTITINNSYYTDKDYAGNLISEKNAFVILNLTIKNNIEKRELKLEKFHVMNGIKNYTSTSKTYQTEFQDFGKVTEAKEIKRGETLNFIMIFKVDKKLKPRRFVLYYQELGYNNSHLRKIKLKINNMTEIKNNDSVKLNEELTFTLEEEEETIVFDGYRFLDAAEYSYRACSSSNCKTYTDVKEAKPGYKILKISFGSDTFEGKDMIDFSSKYGKINYINNKGKKSTISIKNPIDRTYYGKYLYINVPEEVEESKALEIEYIIRNNRYTYKLK